MSQFNGGALADYNRFACCSEGQPAEIYGAFFYPQRPQENVYAWEAGTVRVPRTLAGWYLCFFTHLSDSSAIPTPQVTFYTR